MIEVRVFAGEQPAIAPRLLENPHAVKAQNCLLTNGDLRALCAPQLVSEQPALVSNTQTLYLYGGHWFSFDKRVSVVSSPIRQDVYDRVYFTGLDAPRITRNDIAIVSDTPLPANSYRLGIEAPGTKPAIDYTTATGDDDVLDDITRYYVTTFVSSTGEESKPSPVSDKIVVSFPDTDIVTVGLPTLATNDYDITLINIYRAETGGDDAEFFHIGTVNYGTATFDDDPATYTQGPALATRGYDMPPSDMHSLIQLKGGMLVGASGQTVCPSQAYEPYAYKKENQLVTNAPIVAMAPLPNGAIVATTAYPELLSGYSPDSLALDRFELAQACVSARSMVDMGTMVLYACPDGLVSASVNGASLITEGMIEPRQWQALHPDTIHAYFYKQQYIGFYDTGSERGGFIFDPSRKDLTFLDFHAQAGYRDLATDTLYLLIDNQLMRYDKGQPLTFIWQSKPFDTPPTQYPHYRVKRRPGSMGDMVVRIYADDELLIEDTLTDTDWGFIPPGLYTRWQIEVAGNVDVEAVMLGNSLAELGV